MERMGRCVGMVCVSFGHSLVYCRSAREHMAVETNSKEVGTIYTCPMHPEVRRQQPGICPECGMNLVVEQEHRAHGEQKTEGKHAGHSTAMFFRKFWISLVFTIPVVLYADVIGKIFRWSPPEFPGSDYLPFVFGSIVFFYGGWVFLAGALREIKGRLPGMMTLISIAVTAAYLWSVYAVFARQEALF